jgi:alkylation response protein AidB-like acyl-CoA dehydrogenase
MTEPSGPGGPGGPGGPAGPMAGPLTGLVTAQPWTPTEEQRELRDTVRRVLERHAPPAPAVDDAPGGYDPALWRRLATEVGVAGLGVPEELGGAGGSYLECHVVLVELGRVVAATPYLATMLATQTLLLLDGAGAGVAQQQDLLGRIAEGAATGAVVRRGLVARDTGSGRQDGWVLDGAAELVLDGARADVLLAVTDAGLFRVTGTDGLDRRVEPTMDRSLHLATVRCDGVAAERLGEFGPRERGRLDDVAAVALTAAQVGGAERCLDLTVAYAKQRVQFGRPIGSFQAVKHRLADLLVLVETATTASWAAAAAWAEDAPDAPLLADLAASWCADAYRDVTAETVQLHGGIAITWEHDAHRFFKHAHATATLFGTPGSHRDRLGTHLPG